ncbi:MAG TPA: BatD family protein, partial [Longimicrobiales bacterium]|nr:BatD family protein [Longimicrobiales bacterium]
YFPLRAGEYRLPPARLHYEVRRGFLYAAESRELVSDSARLVVLPLPDEGRPAEYGGAVGSLSMRASIEPRRVAAGQPAMITVELDGTGNVKALPAPVLPDVERVELFAPTQESQVTFDGDRVGGLKRFRWMIVPQRPGEIVIPPIEYAVFDPELRTYAVLRSDTLELVAAPVVAGEPTDVSVRGLRRQPGGERLGWTRAPGFAAAQAVPLLLLAGVVGIRRRRNRPPTVRQRARAARQRLRDLEAGGAADAAAIERTLVSGVLDVLAVDGAAGDPVELLSQAGRATEADRLRALLDELRRARYVPGATFDAASLIARADALMSGLAARGGGTPGRGPQDGGPRGGATSAGILLLPALLGSALLLAPFAGAAQNAAFGRALDLFERGDAAGAANEFHAYASAQPRDVNGWYNAGVAAYHAGDKGRAVWAWLRALRLAPRDADVLHNLRVADAQAVARQVAPRDRLSAGERALAAAAAWWLLCGALAAGVARGTARRRTLWTALPAAAALAAVGLAALLAAGRSSIVVPLGNGATLHAAPTIREEAVGVLRPGAWALVLERRDDWLLIRSQAGTDAWAERTAVATP